MLPSYLCIACNPAHLTHFRTFSSTFLLLSVLYKLHCFISRIWACTLLSEVDIWLVILQDNVPAFESSEAVAIIERNLGGKLLDKYESFDMQPIAAASLGQVIHSGSLLTAATACSVFVITCHEQERNKQFAFWHHEKNASPRLECVGFSCRLHAVLQRMCSLMLTPLGCCNILHSVGLQCAAASKICDFTCLTSVMCLASWPGRQHQMFMALCTMPGIFRLCCTPCHGLGCSANAWHALWLVASCCAVLRCAVLCCAGVLVWDAVPLAWQRALYQAASCHAVLCCVSHSILQLPGAQGCQALA